MIDGIGGTTPQLTEKDILARAEVNKQAYAANVKAVIDGGGTIDKAGNLTPTVTKLDYDAKFYKSGDPGTFMGAPGVLKGLVPKDKIKEFKSQMIEDTYFFARAVGFHFSSLDQLDIKCGIKLLGAFPAILKDCVNLSTDMGECEFLIMLKM